MLAQEIIQLSRIPDSNFRSLVQQAYNHALWNNILYYDQNEDLNKQILDLLKESLSKLLFRFFCLQNRLPIEFNLQNGNRNLSFQIEKQGWELISLAINGCSFKGAADTTSLPALVPAQKFNSTQIDDFGNRIVSWASTTDQQVLFTYLHNNSSEREFLDLILPEGIENLYEDFFDRKQKGKPIREGDFWTKLKPFGIPKFTLHHMPDFFITAWAGPTHWKFFYNALSSSFPNILTFTTNNKAVFIHRLPAFSRLFPQLNDELHFAKFLN